MNLQSCKGCGAVFDNKKVKLIEMELPEEGESDEKDEDGFYTTEHLRYNPDNVWGYRGSGPLETWQCPICATFNGIGQDED